MAKQTLNDGSDGTVVIRPGGSPSGGGSGGRYGGGFGGNRVGSSGGPTRSAKGIKRRQEDRLKRKAEEAQAAAKAKADAEKATAKAQEQARFQARQQALVTMVQRYTSTRAEVDRNFASKKQQLDAVFQKEISAARRPPVPNSTERWQLYTLTKEKNEIDGLIARKTTELNAKNIAARVFDGQDPLTRSATDYRTRLDQFGTALDDGHRLWEQAYIAAQEARLLFQQINALSEKSNALARLHAEQTVVWREREAVWERQRQYAEQRAARIRFKQQVDESIRLERFKQVHTLSVPAPSLAAGGMVLTRDAVFVGQQAAAVLEQAVAASVETLKDYGRILARTGPVFVTAMVYSPELGNGELTPEQRNRLFQGVGVPAQVLGLSDGPALQSIADAGGSVEVAYRLKPQAVPEGTALHVANTGDTIGAHVPVINAVFDPLTGLYHAEVPGPPARHLQFAADAAPQEAPANPPVLTAMTPQVETLPAGVDLRIQDCIICVPGLPPTYFSFDLPALGSGIVTGAGKPAANDWWNTASQPRGAAIPEQVGHQMRAQAIKSFSAFDQALWRTLAEHSALWGNTDDINKKRIERGFAPYAPKSTWVGERREFELRYQARAELGENPFNLDRISITTPNSEHGRPGIVPAVIPWPVPPIGTGTRTPLAPPGVELLGPTTSPITPPLSPVYPGNPVIPVLPQNETFPAVDPGQTGASIPGFPADMELPSPDALFYDRRDDPGMAQGFGQTVSGVWLGEAARTTGAVIPDRIADQLRGRMFANFHGFRKAFWRAVAADVELSKQFNETNLRHMRNGSAPYPSQLDQVGGRKKFELHHKIEVAKGGEVYDVENLVVMTARRHIHIHKGRTE